jgi:hypothetical protein
MGAVLSSSVMWANTSVEHTRRRVYGAMGSAGICATLAFRQRPTANRS